MVLTGYDEEAGKLAELNGILAHRASATVYKQGEGGFGGFRWLGQLQALDHGLHSGCKGQRDDGGLLVCDVVRDRKDEALLYNAVLGKDATNGVRWDAVGRCSLDEACDALALPPRGAVGIGDCAGKVAADDAAWRGTGGRLPVCRVLNSGSHYMRAKPHCRGVGASIFLCRTTDLCTVRDLDEDLPLGWCRDVNLLDGDFVVLLSNESLHLCHFDYLLIASAGEVI